MVCQCGTRIKLYLDLIENVQRRVTRQLPGFRNLTYEKRLKKNKKFLYWRTVEQGGGGYDEVFKIVHNIYDRTTIVFFLKVERRICHKATG